MGQESAELDMSRPGALRAGLCVQVGGRGVRESLGALGMR